MKPSAAVMTRLWQYLCEACCARYLPPLHYWTTPEGWEYARQFPRQPDPLGWAWRRLRARGYLAGDPGAVAWAWEWRWP